MNWKEYAMDLEPKTGSDLGFGRGSDGDCVSRVITKLFMDGMTWEKRRIRIFGSLS